MTYTTWLHAAFVRMVRTAAQAALGIIGASALLSDVKWDVVVGGTGLAALVSVLMSLTGLPETNEVAPLENHGDGGQSTVAILIALVVGFALGALCYANGIFVG